MRKATTGMLVAAGLFAVAGVTQAADRAGVDLGWATGPVIAFGTFDMKFNQSTSLNWNVGEDFSVGVFNEGGVYRAEGSYTDNATPAITHTLVQNGSVNGSGLRLLHSIPGLSFISAGIDAGIVTLKGSSAAVITRSDGAPPTATFGAPADLSVTPITAALMGITGKIRLVHAESKLVTADINVLGALRFVSFPDTAVLGSQTDLQTVPKKIDPVSGYNHLSIMVGLNLGF